MISGPACHAAAYWHPLVPPEWIAASGLRPRWIRLRSEGRPAAAGLRRGVCPFAAGMLEADIGDAAALILTTTCDQMRYAAGMVASRRPGGLFLFNIPHTWQTAASRSLYRQELERLGAFLKSCGGREPTPGALAEQMRRYDAARADARRRCEMLSAVDAAALLAAVRGDLTATRAYAEDASARNPAGRQTLCETPSLGPSADGLLGPNEPSESGLRLAIVGGPLLADDPLLSAVELRGGRVVLDASEGGVRTLPVPLDPARLAADPLNALVDAYFDGFPDPFRRPNERFYEWLGEAIVARRVQAILLHRYLWCDTWHAESDRLRQWSPVPVLELESVDINGAFDGRKVGRLDAFLEMLR